MSFVVVASGMLLTLMLLVRGAKSREIVESGKLVYSTAHFKIETPSSVEQENKKKSSMNVMSKNSHLYAFKNIRIYTKNLKDV